MDKHCCTTVKWCKSWICSAVIAQHTADYSRDSGQQPISVWLEVSVFWWVWSVRFMLQSEVFNRVCLERVVNNQPVFLKKLLCFDAREVPDLCLSLSILVGWFRDGSQHSISDWLWSVNPLMVMTIRTSVCNQKSVDYSLAVNRHQPIYVSQTVSVIRLVWSVRFVPQSLLSNRLSTLELLINNQSAIGCCVAMRLNFEELVMRPALTQ